METLYIIAGIEFRATFTILSDDGMTGQTLDPADTGTFRVDTVGEDPECIISPIDMTIIDLDNGLFEVIVLAEDTLDLIPVYGMEEDGFTPELSHQAILDFTLASGDRTSIAPVSVSGVGTCLE